MDTTKRTILITGATGKQGGAVLRELHGKGFTLRAMTRRPTSEAAQAISRLGVEVVQGDLDEAGSLARALDGVWGVFAVQNTWEAGVEREEEQGKRIAHIARENRVEHFVYSSVGSAHRKTGIPHFDNKWRIEETVRGLGFPSYVIIRPVFFMENLISPWFLNGDRLLAGLRPDTKLQMIATEDIGKIGARAFTHAQEMNRGETDLAGDVLTIPDAAGILSKVMGRKIKFEQVPIEDVRKTSEDFAIMLEWFERVGYDVDIAALEKQFGMRMTKFEEWARKTVKR